MVHEGYIRDNINSEYVDFKDLNVVTDIIVKQTLFDGDYLSGRDTIDDDIDKDVGGKESATVRYCHNGKYVMGQ